MFAAGALLLICAPPILLFSWLVNKHDLVYPWAFFGARAWLFLSGVKVKVRGLELLDPKQTYVFVSNHRSYLDTAAIFIYTGQTNRCAREERAFESSDSWCGDGICECDGDRSHKS